MKRILKEKINNDKRKTVKQFYTKDFIQKQQQFLLSFFYSVFSVQHFALIICCFLASCNSPYVSKKRGYFKIELPERGYQKFENADFPYSFEYPVYAKIIKDSTYFDSNPENPYWINIDFPSFRGRVFLSYKAIGGKALYKVKMPDGKYKDSLGTNVFDIKSD